MIINECDALSENKICKEKLKYLENTTQVPLCLLQIQCNLTCEQIQTAIM
jgi:hypothetical protein